MKMGHNWMGKKTKKTLKNLQRAKSHLRKTFLLVS